MISDVVEMKVTSKKSVGFYTGAATAFLRGVGNKPPVEKLSISGLGSAVNVAVAVAARLEHGGIGKILKVHTDYPEMENGPNCCQMVIEVIGPAALRPLLHGRRVILVRHGNTGKAQVDADRQLTEKGHNQCQQFRHAWGSVLKDVAMCFVSPVSRTINTAKLVLPSVDITEVDDLYFGRWQTDAMKAADTQIGYAPISSVQDNFPGLFEPGGKRMAAAVAAACQGGSAQGDVVIVGHAIFLSFIALEVLEALSPATPGREAWLDAGREVIVSANVGEVCAFEITAAGTRYLPNPESTDFHVVKSNSDFASA